MDTIKCNIINKKNKYVNIKLKGGKIQTWLKKWMVMSKKKKNNCPVYN